MSLSQKTRTAALPIAMVVGAVFNPIFAKLGFLPPYLIFAMLFISFSRVSVRQMKIRPLHWALLASQMAFSVAVYLLLAWYDTTLAQGLMICCFAPVAMAAMVIAGMLGADGNTMATFSLLSNLLTALLAPVIFSLVGTTADMSFGQSATLILLKVGPMLIGPFVLAVLCERFFKKVHTAVRTHQGASFWLWVASLTIVMGRTVRFMLDQPAEHSRIEIMMAVGALIICILQFSVGRWLGRKYGDPAAGGQSMGQKNTVLAIWMAQAYLNPLASVAPAAYVVWQNVVNSVQLWRRGITTAVPKKSGNPQD